MKSPKHRNARRRGFTLVEVLLVLAILGVIAAMVVPNLLGSQKRALVKQTATSIHALETTLQTYAIDHNGVMPEGSTSEMIDMLRNPKDVDGNPMDEPYLTKDPLDAWGKQLNYQYPGTKQKVKTKPDIWSNGPDGQNDDGGGDDINNWTEIEAR